MNAFYMGYMGPMLNFTCQPPHGQEMLFVSTRSVRAHVASALTKSGDLQLVGVKGLRIEGNTPPGTCAIVMIGFHVGFFGISI